MDWTIFIFCIICLIALILLASYCTFRIAFYNQPERYNDVFRLPHDAQYEKDRSYMISLIQEISEIPFEEVSITSFDGLKLYGRYYHIKDGAPLQIQMHGYHGTSLRDFCGGNKIAREMGHNTLLIDQRAHGKSEGRIITFGINERRDCLSWVQYATERFGNDIPIFLCGVSMGASTVLMASELDLPENVVGIMADCPYSSPKEILCKVCDDRHFPSKIAYPFIWLGALLYGRFSLTECTACDAVRNAKVPILLIHGEADYFVPTQMSRDLHEACASVKILETFPDAAHALSYVTDSERYSKIAKDFIHTCLKLSEL